MIDYRFELVQWAFLDIGQTFLVDDQRQGITEWRVLERKTVSQGIIEVRAICTATMQESNFIDNGVTLVFRVFHSGERKLHV